MRKRFGQRIREKIRDRFGFEIDEIKFKGIMTELKLKPKRRQKQ